MLAVLVAVALGAGASVLGFELRGLGSVTQVPANLTVLAVAQNGGALGTRGGRALFHLRCDPAGGNVADPAKACAAIAARPSLVTDPRPAYNWGGNVWHFTITGRLNGKRVHFSGDSSWTPQMALIDKLGLAGPPGTPLHLERVRHGSVAMGQTRTFASGVLRAGDVVACTVHGSYPGPPLAMGIPIRRGVGGYLGAQPGVIGVRVRADGAVTASCLARNQLPLSKRGRTRLPDGWPP